MAQEKIFENQIKRFFHSVGIYPAGYDSNKMMVLPVGWYTKIWGGGFQRSGIPDIIANVNGMFLGLEIKASRGKPSELQKLNVNRINETNGLGVILYPEGFEQFQSLIKGVLEDCNGHIPALNALKNAHTGIRCDIYRGSPI